MFAPWSVRRLTTRRGLALVVSLVSGLALIVVAATAAGAAPQPSVTQVQQRLTQLNTQLGKLNQQYDQALAQLAAASQRLSVLNRQTAADRITFDQMRLRLGRIVAVDYEQGGLSSPLALLTSGSPQEIVDQSSILTELSITSDAAVSQFLLASDLLVTAQRQASQVRQGKAALKQSLGRQLDHLNSLRARQETLLAQLTPAQQAGLGPGGSGGGGVYTGPTATQAEKAVAFAYAQIGKPYQWGGTGPGSYDCSGLVMTAWASAGVSIPRTSYAQMSSLPAVSIAYAHGTWLYLRPGDILGFAGNSHVGIYVGNGYLIDAPQTCYHVEKVALAGWYASSLDGAVRP